MLKDLRLSQDAAASADADTPMGRPPRHSTKNSSSKRMARTRLFRDAAAVCGARTTGLTQAPRAPLDFS
jgi:hypothetical protein